LVRLLQTDAMPQAAVLKHLKPLAKATREVPAKLGRNYLITKGTFYQLTAVFEQPNWNLYQVTLRLDPAAYAQLKAHARSLSAATGAEWKNAWLGMWPKLVLHTPGPPATQVTARFVSLLPGTRMVVLTRA